MAIVMTMLGRGRPLAVVTASLLFSMAYSVPTSLDLAGIHISVDIVHMLPFVAIMLSLIVFGRRAYLPPALALPYVRGAR